MTFKHVKFEDSPTMRALEKVAREKGLVKPEPLTKKASLVKKADLAPTNNLMENILKLCNGLREQGMVKDAAELETKFLQYKQAQTIYETSKETGEDVLEQAHPDGSHKLEDVDSDEAVVEDLIDKHEKIEDVATEESDGKLSDAASVIASVKTVLGQLVAPKESEQELYNTLNERMNQIISPLLGYAVTALKTYGGDGFDADTADEAAKDIRNIVSDRPLTRDKFRKLLAALGKLQSTHNSGAFKTSEWFGSPDDDDPGLVNWNKNVGPIMSGLANKINSLGGPLTKIETIRMMKEQGTYKEPERPNTGGTGGTGGAGTVSIPTVTRPSNDIVGKAYPMLKRVDQFVGATRNAAPWLNDRQKKNGIDWLGREKAAIQAIYDQANSKDPSEYDQVKDLLMNRLNALSGELDQYQQMYLTQKTTP